MKSIALELQRLEFLLIYLKTVSFSGSDAITLYDWLSHCIGLKELWVRNGNIYPEIGVAGFCEHCVDPYYSIVCVRQAHHRCWNNLVPALSHVIII